jgi:hypothetical protein
LPRTMPELLLNEEPWFSLSRPSAAGVIFIESNGDGPGVRLRKEEKP